MTKTYWSADLVPTFNLLIRSVIDRQRHAAYH